MRTTTFPHFWSDRHDREYQRILRMQSLYEGKHCIVLYDREGGWKLPIYVTHNWLGDRLTRTLTALVWRGFPYVAAGEKARQGDLLRILRDTAMRTLTANTQDAVSYAGYASLYLEWSRRLQRPVLRRWGENVGEFAWWELEGHTPWAVTFYKEEMLANWQGRQNVRVKVGERFELDPPHGRVIVRNAAYVVTGVVSALGSYTDPWNLRAEYNPAQAAGTVDTDEPVPLAALYETPPPEEAEMAMTVLPGCPVENVGEGLGVSDYTESLISLQKSMARLATQRDIAIVINEMPAMNVPAHCLNPDGTLDLGKIWVTMSDPGADPERTDPHQLQQLDRQPERVGAAVGAERRGVLRAHRALPRHRRQERWQRRGKRLCAHAGHGEAVQRHRDAPAALGTGVRLAHAGGAATGEPAGAGELR